MSKYFESVSQELLGKLAQVRSFITRHNPTVGLLTEEVLRYFLRTHLPKRVSVEQGFIITANGELSRQCDILIYDSHTHAPFYRINDIVIIPAESVIAVIEVKTTITKSLFHRAIDYFKSLPHLENAKTYLFIFNSREIWEIAGYFQSYKHEGSYQKFDHDSFQCLPDEITGIENSFHLKKELVVFDKDMIGYNSWFFEDLEGSEISAIELFYLSVYGHVESYLEGAHNTRTQPRRRDYHKMAYKSISAIQLFEM